MVEPTTAYSNLTQPNLNHITRCWQLKPVGSSLTRGAVQRDDHHQDVLCVCECLCLLVARKRMKEFPPNMACLYLEIRETFRKCKLVRVS